MRGVLTVRRPRGRRTGDPAAAGLRPARSPSRSPRSTRRSTPPCSRYSRATGSLDAVRRQIAETAASSGWLRKELGLARATLAARAVALYKHDDVTTLDAVLGAADFSDLVSQLTMVRHLARGDRDVVRTVERTKRELADRAVSLAADERTAKKLVGTARPSSDHQRSSASGALLCRRAPGDPRLAAATTATSPRRRHRRAAAAGGGGDGGSGPWWPLIRRRPRAAASARAACTGS